MTIQYLEAVRRLKADGFVPRRTIYLTFVPGTPVFFLLRVSS